MVLLGGEAGVGKTALLRELSARDPRARVLWGACERLFTPPSFGPFLDIAEPPALNSGGVHQTDVPHEFLGAPVDESGERVPDYARGRGPPLAR